MGRYVEFWEGSPDGIEGHFLSLIDQYHEWYEDLITGPYSNEGNKKVYELITKIKKDPNRLRVKDAEHSVLVDLMIIEFYGYFLDQLTAV